MACINRIICPCREDGGTKFRTPSSNTTNPVASRCRCAKYTSDAARNRAYSSFCMPFEPYAIDRLVSSRIVNSVFVSPLESLEVRAIRASVDVPIDVAQIVARHVLSILGKLLAEAEVGRFVQATDEPVDHGLGDQVEARNPRPAQPDLGIAAS